MSVRVPPAAPSAAAAVIVVALLIAAGCGSKPATPEEMFARVAALNEAGETGKIWDLMSEDARQRHKDAIDGYRRWLQRNPDPNQKITRQFQCSRDEFMVLPYVELMRRENLGRERALVDAKITDRSADPRNPGEEVLTIRTPSGPRVYMRVRQASDGWDLVEFLVDPQ